MAWRKIDAKDDGWVGQEGSEIVESVLGGGGIGFLEFPLRVM